MSEEHVLWCEKYRPSTIRDCILPEDKRVIFQEYVNKRQIPNLILAGTPGTGKTTIARALCEEVDCDYIIINGSEESGIDTLRVKIKGYASSVSLMGGRKVVIIDEADYLNVNSTQPAFRGILDEFADNCSFIFTCNYLNKIIEPLVSRFAVVDFKISDAEKIIIAKKFQEAITKMLQNERVVFDPKVLPALIVKNFPDFRKTINDLQKYAVTGTIDSGILAKQSTSFKITEVIGHLKQKDFRALRLWVGKNTDNDGVRIMREVYDNLYEILQPKSIPAAVVLVGKYQYQAAFCADQEVNLMAFFSELMIETDVK